MQTMRTKQPFTLRCLSLLLVLILLLGCATAEADNILVSKLTVGVFGSAGEMTMKVGASSLLSSIILPRNATNKTLKWSSSNPNVATVSEKGKVTAVDVGSCTISCETTDGSNLKETVKVTVEHKYPLVLEDVRVSYNSIGVPQVSLSVKNLDSELTLDAFTFETRCYNAYGTPLKAFDFGDEVKAWIWQEGHIKPGKSTKNDNWCWTLNGFDTAYKIDVWLTEYRMSDGTNVTIPQSDYDVVTWTKY